MSRRRYAWLIVPGIVGWVALLALLPWWLGLPLLLSLAAAALLLEHRLAPRHAALIRRALYWGLAGWLLALPRALGGGVLGWGAALLGALAGYTLLIGLEVWLERDQRRASGTAPSSDWADMACSPIGPPSEIIELQPPAWQPASGDLPDPQGGSVHCNVEGCQFTDGEHVVAPRGLGFAQACFSPQGHWFAACTVDQRVLLLWDRQRERRHRVRGWQLCGWYREQPWLSRREGDMPLALHEVLGADDKG